MTACRYQCQAGDSCRRVNEYYYQCTPNSANDSGNVGSGSSGVPSLGIWEQCGGKGGNCGSYTCADGPYPAQCPSGASCQRLNEWYHQCRPTGSSFAGCKLVGAVSLP